MSDGAIAPDWYRYFAALDRLAGTAASGEVIGGDGLTGGGAVADGVNIGIADGGVTNEKLRDSLATSVMGRFQGTAGQVADIQATGDRRILARQNGMLVFTAHPEIESVEIDELRLTGSASASAATTTHKIAIKIGGSIYYLLLSNV